MGGGLGSGARLRALKQGEIDIAIASHGLDLAALRRDGFAAHRIARTAVVFGVNAAVRAPGLSSAQVCEILAGRVTAWDRVEGTGSRRPLVAIARDESEVDMEVVRAGIPCLAGASVGSIVRIVPDTESMRRALLADSGAFGVTTMTVVVQSGGQIRAIALDGVAPTNSKVADKRYPLVRASYLITSAKPTAAVQQFLNFVRSARVERCYAKTVLCPSDASSVLSGDGATLVAAVTAWRREPVRAQGTEGGDSDKSLRTASSSEAGPIGPTTACRTTPFRSMRKEVG